MTVRRHLALAVSVVGLSVLGMTGCSNGGSSGAATSSGGATTNATPDGSAAAGEGAADATVGQQPGSGKVGSIAIAPRFYEGGHFGEDGLAPVQVSEDGPWGYVDTTGESVIAAQFFQAFDFSGGLAAVWVNEDEDAPPYALIDTTGAVGPHRYHDVRPFHEGLAQVLTDDGDGYIDTSGKLTILRPANKTSAFGDGLAVLHKLTDSGTGTELIDTSGATVVRMDFNEDFDSEGFSEGLLAMQKDAFWGYIDTTGTMVINPEFVQTLPFHEGVAAVLKGGQWGFIDVTGAAVIPLQYDQARSFSEGLAAVQTNDAWGFIDANGATVIPPQYVEAEDFHHGVAAVRKGDTWGFIDPTGAWITQTTLNIEYLTCNSQSPLGRIRAREADTVKVGYIYCW